MVAFRYEALKDAGMFAQGHLIEDYDMTARLKQHNWNVGFVSKTQAWTEVNTSLKRLWKQRVRWTLGGLEVISSNLKNVVPILQDIIGHIAFLSLLLLVAVSFIVPANAYDSLTVRILFYLGWFQFVVMFAFQIWTLRDYPEADWKDWLIRLSILPEFLYSNLLSVLLLGTYSFFTFNRVFSSLAQKIPAMQRVYELGLQFFQNLGYAYAWGTKKYI